MELDDDYDDDDFISVAPKPYQGCQFPFASKAATLEFFVQLVLMFLAVTFIFSSSVDVEDLPRRKDNVGKGGGCSHLFLEPDLYNWE